MLPEVIEATFHALAGGAVLLLVESHDFHDLLGSVFFGSQEDEELHFGFAFEVDEKVFKALPRSIRFRYVNGGVVVLWRGSGVSDLSVELIVHAVVDPVGAQFFAAGVGEAADDLGEIRFGGGNVGRPVAVSVQELEAGVLEKVFGGAVEAPGEGVAAFQEFRSALGVALQGVNVLGDLGAGEGVRVLGRHGAGEYAGWSAALPESDGLQVFPGLRQGCTFESNARGGRG